MAGTSTHHSEWDRGKRKQPKKVSVHFVCDKCGIDYIAEGKPAFIKVTQRAFDRVHNH